MVSRHEFFIRLRDRHNFLLLEDGEISRKGRDQDRLLSALPPEFQSEPRLRYAPDQDFATPTASSLATS